MLYRRPFTLLQRRDALRVYRSFREHLRALRKNSPPANDQQQQVLNKYREHVHDIRTALELPDARVSVDELNESIRRAGLAVAEYFSVRHFGK